MTDTDELPEADTDAAFAPAESKPAQVAKIRTLVKGVAARGFTFGAGQIVPLVPLAHAEYLKDQGEAVILEVTP